MDKQKAAPVLERKPFEQWALEKNTPMHFLCGARIGFAWATGQELTEQAFDDALEHVQHGAIFR